MVGGSNRRQLKQTLNKFTTLFQKKEDINSTQVLHESSTKRSLYKLKSLIKNSSKENTTKTDSAPVKHVRFVIFPEIATSSIVANLQMIQPKEKFANKRPLKSCFKTIKKDTHAPVTKQQQSGRKRRVILNKIQSFFNKKIAPVFEPSLKKENMTELETRLYEKFSKASEAEHQLKHTERLSMEIKSMEQQQIQRKQKYQTEFNTLHTESMEEKRQEYELKEIDVQFKKMERDGQLQKLQQLILQLRLLEKQISQLQSQESATLAQRRLETVQKKGQKRLIENQKQQQKLEHVKQTELYAWQLNQVRKKIQRQGEHCNLYSSLFPLNPWRAKKELKKEHDEQLKSWRLRYIDLQKKKPNVPRSRDEGIKEIISKIPPWELDQIIKCEGKRRQLLREFEEMKYRQTEEEAELRLDTINYFTAYWDTKKENLGRAIQESEITRQLNILGKKLGTSIANFYHELI